MVFPLVLWNMCFMRDMIVFAVLQARTGRAYLFTHAMNIVIGAKEDRQLMTGLHTVADVKCSDCGEVLGWKYVRAYDETQKYKEGKFVLENFKIVKEN
ncbi:Protein yippee-like [Capsicum annuum]|nr:Protein yippee-like [Capsicum annuum]KAF3635442.1 Protein yippee-like [Capsicum annuum]